MKIVRFVILSGMFILINQMVKSQELVNNSPAEIEKVIFQNHQNNVNPYQGINITFQVTVAPEYRNTFSASDIETSKETLKNHFELENVSSMDPGNKELVFLLSGEKKIPFDELKIKFTELGFIVLAMTGEMSLK
jgi:hypothetical protein